MVVGRAKKSFFNKFKKVIGWGILIIVIVQVVVFVVFYTLQFNFLFRATPLPANYQFSFSEPFHEIFLKVGKASINGLYFESQEKRGCVVYFHGNADNLAQWGSIAPDFTYKGFDLLIVDYPTFGKSTGSLSEANLLKMGRNVLAYALKFYPPEKIVLYGRSMGTGIASKIAGESKVGLLILETPYLSIKDLVDYHAPRFTPSSLILRLRFNNRKNLKEVECPIVIFHGTLDEIIPYEQAKELSKSLKANDWLVTIQNGNHRNLNQFKQYHDELKKAFTFIH